MKSLLISLLLTAGLASAATEFLEPGGDCTFGIDLFNTNSGSPSAATDFVHGGHQRSIKFRTGQDDFVGRIGVLADAGRRTSTWIYLNALPSATASIISYRQSNGTTNVVILRLTSAGVLQLWNTTTAQIGSNGATLSTGTWYRISMAYTITSTTVNSFTVYVNGASSISTSNQTLGNTGTNVYIIGNTSSNSTLDLRVSDIYVDNGSSGDPGNIWVTAKRPFSNGTTNGFTTQIGSGGSGYGSGHTPQENERPLSTADGWSIVVVASAVTEEYSIETQSEGDINISTGTIVDFEGWISAGSSVSESDNMILVGSTIPVSVTSTITIFLNIAGSSTYPVGNTDIGLRTNTAAATASLYEAGIAVAYIPAAVTPSCTPSMALLGVSAC